MSSEKASSIGRARPAFAAAAIALAVLAPASRSHAQFGMMNSGGSPPATNIEGLTVAGKGTVVARPNLVEIDLDISSASELTSDAIVKYRDSRKSLREAFAALKLDDVTLEERGLLVDQKGQQNNYYFGGFQQNTRAKTEVQLSRKIVVKAANIRKLDEEALLQRIAKLLDVAQDAGAKIGHQNEYNPYAYYRYNQQSAAGLVRFVVDDFDKLQEEAYEKAIADARTRAERLARLSGVELGPVVAVREVSVPGDSGANHDDEESTKKRLETSKFQPVPVRVELMVRFEVRPKAQGKDKPR